MKFSLSLETVILLAVYLSIPATGGLAYAVRQPIPHLPISIPMHEFKGTEAYGLLRDLTHDFPGRVVGTENGTLSASWIASWFQGLGLNATLQMFPTIDFLGHRVNGTNVYAISPGITNRVLILLAHRDVTPPAPEGANDNGSGTVVLMELARTLTRTTHNLTYYFLSTDSEEINLGGSRYFAEHTAKHLNVTLALSIDEVGYKQASSLLIYAYNHQNNYTDAGTMLLASSIGQRLNLATAPQIPDQLARRAGISLFSSDSESFLAQGIQSYAIGDDNPLYPYAESALDRIDQISADRLDLVGQWVETLTYNLNLGLVMPTLGGTYIIYSDGYTPGNELILHLATYPLAAIAAPTWLLLQRRPDRQKFLGAGKSILITFLILLISALMPLAYRFLGFWPPTSANIRSFLTVFYVGETLAIIALLSLFSTRVFSMLRISEATVDPEYRHIWTMILLSSSFLLGIIVNPFATILFLSLPPLLAPLAQTRRRGGTSLRLLLSLLTPFPLYAVAIGGILIFGPQGSLSLLISEIALGGPILFQLAAVVAILMYLGQAFRESIASAS